MVEAKSDMLDRAGRTESFLDRAQRFGETRLFTIVLMISIMAIGLAVRLEEMHHWQAEPERAFFNNEPGLINLDGYFYLHLAKDLTRASYDRVDTMRAAPDYPPRPWPPPLLSVLTAGIKEFTPFTLNWIAVVLPPFLGVLLAIPLYLLGRFYGGKLMGFTAAFTGVLVHYYVYRSGLGWFDTDCMNVTFTLAIAYCFLRFGHTPGRAKYYFFLAGIVLLNLFVWWWDQAESIAIIAALFPLLVALVFSYRPGRTEGIIFYAVLALVSMGLLMLKGFDLPLELFKDVFDNFMYISKQHVGDFPNEGINVSEQVKPGLVKIIELTTSNFLVFVMAMIGILLLFILQPRRSLYLFVPVCIALLSFFHAIRFLIFLVPLIALGLGFIASRFLILKKQHPAVLWITPLLVLVSAWPMFTKNIQKVFFPRFSQPLVAGMNILSEKTFDNSVVWSSWDQGYALIYWADRSTINDGSSHIPERSFYTALPLATDNFRFAANFMQFYVTQGVEGLQKFYQSVDMDRARGVKLFKSILMGGPQTAITVIGQAQLKPVEGLSSVDEWLRYFYPSNPPPVYLYLSWYIAEQADAWFWLGTWDINDRDGIHPGYSPHYEVTLSGSRVLNPGKDLEGDLRSGRVRAQDKTLLINDIRIHNAQSFTRHQTGVKGYIFDLYRPGGFATIGDENITASVFHRLFVRHQQNDYFRPVYLDTPDCQVWEIKGDQLL